MRTSDSVIGFRSVFKATSIFGGVQIFNILIALIRGKVLAILIGTEGMGLNGLLNSSLTLITKASGLGLNESAVRDISAAHSSHNTIQIQRVYTIFRRWIWFTAFIGLALTISFSPIISKLAFGDYSLRTAYIFLSITFIFGALNGGIYTLLRGMRRIKDLAQANIAGSIAGLLISIPIFYFYRMNGIVPAIIATSFVTYLVSIYFRRKTQLMTTNVSLQETFSEGKEMVLLGLTLSASSLITAGAKFVLNVYISKTGSLHDLGIYNAGNSIMAGYVGMVFTAIGTDYYPKLSGVISSKLKWKAVVNQQAETVLLILGPILTFILLSAPFLIRILLSSEFSNSIGFIIWSSMAILLKGIVWVSGFIIIAKRETKLFLTTEIIASIIDLSLNILFFNLFGTTGLGISMSISYIFSATLMYYVLKTRYNFVLSTDTYKLCGLYLLLMITGVICISFLDYPKAYYFTSIIFIISLFVSIRGLNNRMELVSIIKKYMKRN